MEDASKLGKVHAMLDEDIFWDIVDKSVTESNSSEKQEQILINEITKLSLKQIIGFRLRTDYLLFDTYNSEMWCAGYLMNQGCSDDGFEYFRNWVISRGRETYYKAKTNPDSLISQIGHKVYGFYEFEEFWYVALEAFKKRTGKELYDYVDYEKFKTREGNYPNFEFTWREEEPESMKNLCPRLYKEFWN